jgi:CheY-like chemotaxis protein
MVEKQQPTVLYVEDEPVNVMLMRVLFERRPHLRLEVAMSFQEAERLALLLQPVLLLLDLRLPDGHGAALLMRLRERPGWEALPAVAVTAETDFDPRGTGFLEVWRKPLNTSRLLDRLDELLAAGLHGSAQPLSIPEGQPVP